MSLMNITRVASPYMLKLGSTLIDTDVCIYGIIWCDGDVVSVGNGLGLSGTNVPVVDTGVGCSRTHESSWSLMEIIELLP